MGADWPLVQDGLIFGALVLSAGIAASFVLFDRFGPRRPPRRKLERRFPEMTRDELEERVRVLERIATDASAEMSGELNAGRERREVK